MLKRLTDTERVLVALYRCLDKQEQELIHSVAGLAMRKDPAALAKKWEPAFRALCYRVPLDAIVPFGEASDRIPMAAKGGAR